MNVEWVGEGRKKYGKASVEYTYNGEARRQNVMSFTNPDVFKKVQELTGQTVEVEVGKNDKGYSEWRAISASSAGTGNSNQSASTGGATSTRVSGSNYETKEERANRQVLIVRQSSLGAAVETLSTGAKTPPTAAAVLELAQEYVDWVFENDLKLNNPSKGGSIEDMSEDLPFN